MLSAALKDYVDQLSYLVDTSSFDVLNFIGTTVSYLFHSLVFIIRYVITFQWLFAFQELPTSFRQNYHMIFQGKNIMQEGLLEPNFYPILNAGQESKHFITGLLNGCFLAFPCTIPQMLGFRALIINGWPVATVYILGAVTGQALFWFCVLFGFDFILTPLLDFHPFMLIVGALLVVNVIWDTTRKPNFQEAKYDLRDFKHFPPELKQQLFKIFRSNVALAWFENHCLGRYIGNLTFDSTSSVLQTGDHWWLINTFGYWLGLAVGMALWSVAFGWAWIRIYGRLVYLWPKLSLPRLKVRYHYVTTVALLTMAFNTVPYYGVDYLATGPLGFIYHDSLSHIEDYHTPSRTYYEAPLKHDETTQYHLDLMPFDDDTVTFFNSDGCPINEEVRLEGSRFASENQWHNRYVTRQKYEERKHTASGITESEFKRNFYGIDDVAYSPYEATGLEIPEEIDPWEEIVREAEYLDTLADHLFREDVYAPPVEFADMDEGEWVPEIATQRVFRQRVVTNPVYKTLLKMEVLPFLGGQPGFHHVSLDDDVDLYEQRVILDHYLTSVEDYRRHFKRQDYTLPKHVYNQQFKGSINIIGQFDAVSVVYPDRNRLNLAMTEGKPKPTVVIAESETQPIYTKVLSYDQTLYNRWHDDALSVLHEELRPLLDDEEQSFDAKQADAKIAHMVNYESGPLYFGWDASLHKLLINTSRLPVPSHDTFTLDETEPMPPYFAFQAWPQNIHDSFRHYRFFDLSLTDEDHIEKLKYILGFIPEEDILRSIVGDFKKDMMSEAEEIDDEDKDQSLDTAISQNKFFSRLPQYDWAWKRIWLQEEALENDEDETPFIEIGHALPPKIDGIAWPGVINRQLNSYVESKS